MKNSTFALTDQTAVKHLQLILASYLSREADTFTVAHLADIPALPQVMRNRGFTRALQNFSETLADFKEMDVALQQYILGRHLHEIDASANYSQEALAYKNVIDVFARYNIDASTYLKRLDDKQERLDAEVLLKQGAASYVKRRLETEFETARLAVDDMHIIQSENAKPSDRLESLLRPFTEAVKYNSATKAYEKPEWFELLGVLETAGWSFDEQGLVEAIRPANVFTNTIMDFPTEEPSPV